MQRTLPRSFALIAALAPSRVSPSPQVGADGAIFDALALTRPPPTPPFVPSRSPRPAIEPRRLTCRANTTSHDHPSPRILPGAAHLRQTNPTACLLTTEPAGENYTQATALRVSLATATSAWWVTAQRARPLCRLSGRRPAAAPRRLHANPQPPSWRRSSRVEVGAATTPVSFVHLLRPQTGPLSEVRSCYCFRRHLRGATPFPLTSRRQPHNPRARAFSAGCQVRQPLYPDRSAHLPTRQLPLPRSESLGSAGAHHPAQLSGDPSRA